MRHTLVVLSLSGLAALGLGLLSACGEASEPSTPRLTGQQVDAEDKADSGAAGSGAHRVALRGQLSRRDGTPAASIELCATRLGAHLRPTRQPPECTTSDADGHYSIELRPRTNYEITLTGAGLFPSVTLFRTGRLPTEYFATLIDEALVPIFYTLAGFTFNPTLGLVTGDAYRRDVEDGAEPPPNAASLATLAGFSFELRDSGAAPVYLNDQGLPDLTLQATTVGGQVVAFANVAEGDYDAAITARPGDQHCGLEHRPRGQRPGTVRVRVKAGAVSAFWFRCRPSQP